MILDETYTLTNGVRIPKLGVGTWLVPDGQAAQVVKDAVKAGYRHIDTAQAYENEVGVGKGIALCGVPRQDLFITTKVYAETKDHDAAALSVDTSLKKLGLDYIDLIIIHCPQPWNEFRGPKRYFAENKEVWRALEEAYDAGKVRAIGVSNFLTDDLENILDGCRIRPMINQIKIHPGCTPTDVIDFSLKEGILPEAYSPIAHGDAIKSAQLTDMAARYGVSVAQLCIRYTLQLGAVSLPKSLNPVHMASNAQVDFEISAADMESLKELKL